MQAVFDRNELRKALKAVTNVVEKRAQMPALHNVLVSVHGGGEVTLRGSNLEIGISRMISGGGEEPGETLLPARQLSAIVEHLPADVVSLVHEEGASQATISAGQAWFQLYTMDPAEYPRPQEMAEAVAIRSNADVITDALARVQDARSEDATQYVISGVLLHFSQNDCRAVATDGRRCAVASMVLRDGEEPEECDAVLPGRAVREILRAVPSGEDCVVYIDAAEVRIVAGSVEVNCRQIEGAYPNYKQIIPEETPYRICAPRSMLLDAVERVALATDDGNSGVALNIGDGKTELEAESEVGKSRELLEDVNHNLQEDARILLNPDFFRDGLKNMPGDYAVISFATTTTAMLCQDNETSGYQYILMPLREN